MCLVGWVLGRMEIGEGKERNFHFLLFVRGENRVEGKWGLKSFLSKAHKSLSKMDKKHGEKTWGRQNVKITPTFPSSLPKTHIGKHKYFLFFHFSIVRTKQSLKELYYEEGVISILITRICCWFFIKKKHVNSMNFKKKMYIVCVLKIF